MPLPILIKLLQQLGGGGEQNALPAGTQFLFAYHYDWNGWTPFTPTLVTDEYAV